MIGFSNIASVSNVGGKRDTPRHIIINKGTKTNAILKFTRYDLQAGDDIASLIYTRMPLIHNEVVSHTTFFPARYETLSN